MSNIPKLRIARITKLVKHNATNDASNIRWIWQEKITEELQYLDENNNWLPVPVEEIYDDSAKKNEEESHKNKLQKAFEDDLSLFNYLKELPNPKEYWHPMPADGKFGLFLDCEDAELDYHPAPDGWTYYYGKHGSCAKFNNKQHLVRGDLLMNFLDPKRFFSFK